MIENWSLFKRRTVMRRKKHKCLNVWDYTGSQNIRTKIVGLLFVSFFIVTSIKILHFLERFTCFVIFDTKKEKKKTEKSEKKSITEWCNCPYHLFPSHSLGMNFPSLYWLIMLQYMNKLLYSILIPDCLIIRIKSLLKFVYNTYPLRWWHHFFLERQVTTVSSTENITFFLIKRSHDQLTLVRNLIYEPCEEYFDY